jgi:chemotaxis protein methyltransferase CheR
MTRRFSDIMLRNLSEFLSARMGLYFPERRWRDLEKGIISAARELGCSSPEECITRLLSSDLTKGEIEILASYLTVGETYFFRDKKSFEAIEEYILPELIRNRAGERRLRIWSAACSTGEEPYSLAILLQAKIPDIRDWHITILASDINPRFLDKAREGVYGDWSFRDCPAWIRNRHFEAAEGGRYRIKKNIREMVTFTYHNLAEDSYPALVNNTSAMDLILCRNVLMYFSDEGRTRVAESLYKCLVDKGFLFVSAGEISNTLFSNYEAVSHRGTTFYRKDAGWREAREVSADLKTGLQAKGHDLYFPEVPDMIPEPGADELKPEEACRHISAAADEIAAVETKEARVSFYEEGLALYERGLYEETAEKMRASLAESGFDTAAVVLLARAYANLGKVREALEWGRKAVSLDKMNPALHYLVAVIEQEEGQAAEAAASLKKALYLDQNFAVAHFALGNLMLRMGRPGEAARHFENALSVLRVYGKDEILPESDGITAGRLAEIIKVMTLKEMTLKEKTG